MRAGKPKLSPLEKAMTVHHVDIYHCQKCGKVTNCENGEKQPECCGEPMVRAVANITYDNSSNLARSVEEVIQKSHQTN